MAMTGGFTKESSNVCAGRVENNQVVSVYVIGSKTNTDPFEIGEKREEVEKEFHFHPNSRFKRRK